MSGLSGAGIVTGGWAPTLDQVVELPTGLRTVYDSVESWLTKSTGGLVYPYKSKALIDSAKFRKLCTVEIDPGQSADRKTMINAWFFHRVNTPEQREDGANTCQRQHTFKITGYWDSGLNNAEEYFNKVVVEGVCAEFRIHESVSRAESGAVAESDPLQVDDIDWYIFTDFLCLRCEMSYQASEEVVWRPE